MKVLSCKIQDELYVLFKSRHGNTSLALRELVTNYIKNDTKNSSIPKVYQQITASRHYDLDLVHKAVDSLPAVFNGGLFK